VNDTSQDAPIVVDLQRGFDDPALGDRSNPDCATNAARLVAHWRECGLPVVFVRHDSLEPGSPLHTGASGNALMPELDGEPDLLVVKHVHSAFHGDPDLNEWLRTRDVDAVTVCGIATDHCCETTARVACDLGYRVRFVLDTTSTFPREPLLEETRSRPARPRARSPHRCTASSPRSSTRTKHWTTECTLASRRLPQADPMNATRHLRASLTRASRERRTSAGHMSKSTSTSSSSTPAESVTGRRSSSGQRTTRHHARVHPPPEEPLHAP